MSKKTSIVEREEYIVELLKESKGESVTALSLTKDLGISHAYTLKLMRSIMHKHPQIRNIGPPKTGCEYVWVEDDISDTIDKKNPEGYPDPTPEKAINNKKQPMVDPKPGEVWATMESNGATGKIFVLNSLNGAAQCIKLFAATSEQYEIIGDDPFIIHSTQKLLGDPTHATFKPLRYCTRRILECDTAKLMEARKRIASVYGIRCFTPEVIEKEVIKEVEVPVEKIIYKDKSYDIPDDYIDTKTAEIAILTEQRDIWEAVARALLEKLG